MNKLYKVKLKREMKVWGFLGHRGPYAWEEIVKLINEAGVQKVQYVQHADKGKGGSHRLDGKEMLFMWKDVERNKIPN